MLSKAFSHLILFNVVMNLNDAHDEKAPLNNCQQSAIWDKEDA
jgi:hypothetical protein